MTESDIGSRGAGFTDDADLPDDTGEVLSAAGAPAAVPDVHDRVRSDPLRLLHQLYDHLAHHTAAWSSTSERKGIETLQGGRSYEARDARHRPPLQPYRSERMIYGTMIAMNRRPVGTIADRTAEPSDLSGTTRRMLRSRSWEIVETHHPAKSGTDLHRHERSHFCLVVAGEVEDGSRGNRWAAGPGTLLFFPAGVAHTNRFAALGARCLNLRAHGSRIASDLEALDLRHPVRVETPEAAWLAGQLYDATVEGDAGGAEGLATRLVDRTFWSGNTSASDPEWLERAREILEEPESRTPGLAEISDRLGVDRFQLARRFRQRYGCSLGQYRHRLQIQKARHELLVTDASLSSVAFRTGFADQSHFTRLFKRYTGMTPGTFRLAAR